MTPDGSANAWALALDSNAPLVVALSGGGDSLALLHAALHTGRRVVAAILDHGVRPGSDVDAAQAALWAWDAGAIVAQRRLEGLTGQQTTARAARYAALADIAAEAGATCVLLGHTQDDQAETVLMRAARGAGPEGLAGMAGRAWCGVWPDAAGLRLSRPFLTLTRADLRAKLRALDQPWLDDPSNTNARFDRTHARAALANDPALRGRLSALADRFQALIVREKADAWTLWGAIGACDQDQAVGLKRPGLCAAPRRLARRVLGAALAAASNAPRPADAASIGRLLDAVTGHPTGRRTLNGADVAWKGASLEIRPEPRRATARPSHATMPATDARQRLRQLLTLP